MFGTSLVLGIEQVIHVNLQRCRQFFKGRSGPSFTTRFSVDDFDALFT